MTDFTKLLQNSRMTLSQKAREAVAWLKSTVNNALIKRNDPERLFTKDGTPTIGQMYMFVYDPKHKATLPFYDMYPLVFPIEFYGDGFLGINLHYLPPVARARLMDALKTIATDDKYTEKTKLNISYELLKVHATKFRGFENCVKRYLFAHVRSSFHQVSASDWDKAVMLPLQRWVVNPNRKYAGSPPY